MAFISRFDVRVRVFLAVLLTWSFSHSLLAAPLGKKPLASKSPPGGEVTVELAHALSGPAKTYIETMVNRFNNEQTGGRIHLRSFEGLSKPALLNVTNAAHVRHWAANHASFKPLYQAMREAVQPPASGTWLQGLETGDLGGNRKPIALPIAFSTPVLFYDKKAFRRAGLNPEKPPQSWQEMQQVAGKLAESGAICPYTTSWPAWIHIDNISALSGVPVADKTGTLRFNALPQIRHLARLSAWYKAEFFKVFGSRDEADHHFARGECAMLTSQSSAYAYFQTMPGLELGVAPLPHDEEVYDGRQHTLADGAALWVGSGFSKAEYQLAVRFMKFWFSEDVQLGWAQAGSFIPMTPRLYQALANKTGGQRASSEEKLLSVYSQTKGDAGGIRIAGIEPLRAIVDEELNAVWANRKPAMLALESAVTRGNALLKSQPALKRPMLF